MGYGMRGHIGFAPETSGGTPVGASGYVEAMSENLSTTLDRFETRNIIGRLSEGDDSAFLERNQGQIMFNGFANPLGFFLAHGTGVRSTSEVLSGFLYSHVFTMATDDWDSNFAMRPLTFEMFRDVTSSQRYTGANIGGLTLALAPNQGLQVTASLIAKAVSQLTKTTPSYSNSPSQPFAFETASISIGGTATALIEGLTANNTHSQEGIPSLNNSTTIRAIRRSGAQTIRLSGNLAFENITEKEAFRNQTEQRFVMSLTRGQSFQLIQDFPRVVYTTFAPVMAGRDRIVVGFEGTARYHTGSGNAMKITLTNNQSGY